LRKSHVRIAARDHFWHIAMRDPETTRKVLDFVGKECVSGGLADERLHRCAIAGTSLRFNGIGLRDARWCERRRPVRECRGDCLLAPAKRDRDCAKRTGPALRQLQAGATPAAE